MQMPGSTAASGPAHCQRRRSRHLRTGCPAAAGIHAHPRRPRSPPAAQTARRPGRRRLRHDAKTGVRPTRQTQAFFLLILCGINVDAAEASSAGRRSLIHLTLHQAAAPPDWADWEDWENWEDWKAWEAPQNRPLPQNPRRCMLETGARRPSRSAGAQSTHSCAHRGLVPDVDLGTRAHPGL